MDVGGQQKQITFGLTKEIENDDRGRKVREKETN